MPGELVRLALLAFVQDSAFIKKKIVLLGIYRKGAVLQPLLFKEESVS